MSLNTQPTLNDAFLLQGVKLPLHVSKEECGVILDADGRDVLTVDSNGFQPDDQVNAIAALIAACINQSPGVTFNLPPVSETDCETISDGPTYLDFITPDAIFEKGPAAVREWQQAKLAEVLGPSPQAETADG
ncbi:hypothetical protein [Ensifer sp. ZNC0028]|uniref:hypothetical protein n=1 Tax=Ensifer sp. ZNC0028 TaxID=1339236 RepID=UPI0006902228|nr:hypothetical protein [Ensifer sp. ZNC0028]